MILYLFLEFFSILLFFILVMIFHINITDGPLLGYILFCQLYMLSVRTKETFLFSLASEASLHSRTIRMIFYCTY